MKTIKIVQSLKLNQEVVVLTKEIGNEETFTIVDIGSTHCGSIDIAKVLIDHAKEAGVDCVKFQKRCINSLLTKKGREQPYKSKHAMANTYGKHREIMEFKKEQFIELRNYAVKKGLFFTASPWDKESLDFLLDINVPFIKIASSDLTNITFLKEISLAKKPIVMSTGMADMKDVVKARSIFLNNELAILHCTSSYPTPLEDVNLNVITTYKNMFKDCVIGFSGHTKGYEVALGAVALGAKIIEKHLTFSNEAIGSDHKSALLLHDLMLMVEYIKNMDKALGSYEKKIQESEKICIKKLCKSVVSKRKIKKGEQLTEDMLTTKSPNTGIPAKYFYDILGTMVLKDIDEDETINFSDINFSKIIF
jgi:sialic acid synthase SpsE